MLRARKANMAAIRGDSPAIVEFANAAEMRPAAGQGGQRSYRRTRGDSDEGDGAAVVAKRPPAPTRRHAPTAVSREEDDEEDVVGGAGRRVSLRAPGALLAAAAPPVAQAPGGTGVSYGSAELAALRASQKMTHTAKWFAAQQASAPAPSVAAGNPAVATEDVTLTGDDALAVAGGESGDGDAADHLAAAAQTARTAARAEVSLGSVLAGGRAGHDSYTPLEYAAPGLAADVAMMRRRQMDGEDDGAEPHFLRPQPAGGGAHRAALPAPAAAASTAPPVPVAAGGSRSGAPAPGGDVGGFSVASLLAGLQATAAGHRAEAATALAMVHASARQAAEATREAAEAQDKLAGASARFDLLAAVRLTTSHYLACLREKGPLVEQLFRATAAVATKVRDGRWHVARTRLLSLYHEDAAAPHALVLTPVALLPQPPALPPTLPGSSGGVDAELAAAAARGAPAAGAASQRLHELLALLQGGEAMGHGRTPHAYPPPAPSVADLAAAVSDGDDATVAAALAAGASPLASAHALVFGDVREEFARVDGLLSRYAQWRAHPDVGKLYQDSYAYLSLPEVLAPLVRHQTWPWCVRWLFAEVPGLPLPDAAGLDGLPWFAPLWSFTEVGELRTTPQAASLATALDADERLLPAMVADVVSPALLLLVQRGYDPFSPAQTAALAAQVAEVHLYDLPPESSALLVGAVSAALLAAAQACVAPVVVVTEGRVGSSTALAVARAAALRHVCGQWLSACREVPGIQAAVGGCLAALAVGLGALREWVRGGGGVTLAAVVASLELPG
jgi:hypothetical protein